MNRIKDLVIQFCKFGAVGGLCFGIDYGLMIFLTALARTLRQKQR